MRNILLSLVFGASALLTAFEVKAEPVVITSLVSDLPGAQLLDPKLVNPWGVSFSGGSPFWVSNNGTGTSTLYSVTASNVVTKVPLTVSIPGDGSVTGQANNSLSGSGAFNGDNFLFVSEDGTVSGWRNALGTTAEILQSPSTNNVYKGSALDVIGTNAYLLEANFRNGTIDVLKGTAGIPDLAGKFTDPGLPAGYAPFNVQILNGKVYVTYALQDAAKKDDVAGAGNGIVSVFNLDGTFVQRLTTGGVLNSPWGLAIAPSTFGSLAGKLLVGNFGDGRISAFDPTTGASAGQVTDTSGNPISISGLWALTPGNGGSAGSTSKLYFTAGIADETHGLFGVLVAVPEPSPMLLGGLTVIVGFAVRQGRRIRAKTASAQSR